MIYSILSNSINDNNFLKLCWPGIYNQLLFLLILPFFISCGRQQEKGHDLSDIGRDRHGAIIGIYELKKGDIIVKPNINLLPGTAWMQNGWGYGHAAIVTKGFEHSNPDSLLAGSMIFESHARDVLRAYQLREVPGYYISDNPVLHNDNFGPKYTGSRYRLRLDIPESQIDSIIAFVRSQKGCYSSWNAMKRYPGIPQIEQLVKDGKRENWADNTHWYCSLLVWQAVLYVTGIDLDPNGGYFVYPSDLIASPYFDNTDSFAGRARF